ncbi:hypothetical protein JCGZ_01938 [Jatropha curcas]|uniref:Aminotransferase-like plant mobile domain-containing protein n=1 Tax=Jatropha curcas TaxID=180498 RepID=A0A067L1R9_JATCU|nr:hypothetical protein JCGZ_01938 [Jatropha curcas]
MASSDLSSEDYLESLGISLDEVNLTADAVTHASVTGIFAKDPYIKLDVGETSMSQIPTEIFDPSHPVGAIISPSHLGYLRHFDAGRTSYKELLGALAERWWDTTNTFHFPWGEMIMTPVDFSVISGIPFGTRPIELYDDWRTEISPDRMVELIGIDLPRIVGSGSTPALSTQAGRADSDSGGQIHVIASTFWSNRKEKFNPSILKSLENLAHLTEYDWAGAILSRMYDDMCGLSRSHCKVSGTYYFWETWAFEYFPYTRPEQIRADLGLGLVEVGVMATHLQSWIQVNPRFQRSDALSRRRVVLSHPVLRRYYLGERVDFQIRGYRSIPCPPPKDMRAGKHMTLTDAHTEGVPYEEFSLDGDYVEFCRLFLMQPVGSRLDNFQRLAPFHPPATRSSRASDSSSSTPRRGPTTDPSSSTPVKGSSQAGPSHSVGHSRAPRAVSEATESLHPDLANLRLPYSISYHTPDVPLAFREVSLENVDRLALPSEDITEVPAGLVNQMMELILGMQQELSSSWTREAYDDQRRRRFRR